jgi:hypothetical protein
MEFIYEAEFWVAVSFFMFIGVLVYLGIHNRANPTASRCPLANPKGGSKRKAKCIYVYYRLQRSTGRRRLREF